MAVYSGAINLQGIYEVLIPFRLKYPYAVIIDGKRVESQTELFPEEKRDELLDELQAQEIEIGTTYKLRPVVIICDFGNGEYLALAITKKKDNELTEFFLAVCDNRIKERHFLSQRHYSDKLKYDSYVLSRSLHLVSKENVQYHRGRLRDADFQTIQSKLKKVLS